MIHTLDRQNCCLGTSPAELARAQRSMRPFAAALLCAIAAPVAAHTQGVCALTSPTIKGRLVVMVRTRPPSTPALQHGRVWNARHKRTTLARFVEWRRSRYAQLRRAGRHARAHVRAPTAPAREQRRRRHDESRCACAHVHIVCADIHPLADLTHTVSTPPLAPAISHGCTTLACSGAPSSERTTLTPL